MNVPLLFLYIATFYMCIDFYLVFQIASKLLAKTITYLFGTMKKNEMKKKKKMKKPKNVYMYSSVQFSGAFFSSAVDLQLESRLQK